MTEFVPFPKVPRYFRDVVITEKLDGTNACVYVCPWEDPLPAGFTRVDLWAVRAASRTRWIAPGDDNFGFAAWVKENAEDLVHLGPGYHFGEWWGRGIQRNYGLTERRFSLFNTRRWADDPLRPKCCHVVPTLFNGMLFSGAVEDAFDYLMTHGSQAAPGFMKPEGVMVYHIAANQYFKFTGDGDGHKGKEAA